MQVTTKQIQAFKLIITLVTIQLNFGVKVHKEVQFSQILVAYHQLNIFKHTIINDSRHNTVKFKLQLNIFKKISTSIVTIQSITCYN
jgi:hypothetical protein